MTLMPKMASSGGTTTTRFVELLEFFERNIEHMESKVRELESELNDASDERYEIERAKIRLVKIEEEKNHCKKEILMYGDQVKNLQMENQELLEEVQLKNTEVEDYRQKYLDALQRCEDQSCEITALKSQIARQADLHGSNTMELKTELMQRELSQMQHLPVELKAKQVEIDEIRSALKIRDNTIDALAKDLEQCLVHSEKLTADIEMERVANKNLLTEINNLKNQLEEKVKQKKELIQQREVTERQNVRIIELEECLERNRTITQTFEDQLQMLREESAKQIVRIRERAETQRGALQAEISGLERELAHARAALKAAGKERDETRSRMKLEVFRLEGKFNEAQLEIRNLRGNIDLLKNSYSSLYAAYDEDDQPN